MTEAKLTCTLEGETDVIVTRRFRAPPALVYRAHVDPDLIPRWMGGNYGYTMPRCESDARPGGLFHYGFDNAETGHAFHIAGHFIALEPDRRIEHVERMFLPDPTPENHIVTSFEPSEGGTLLRMHMHLPDAATREAMMATGMTDGMELTYAQLDALDLVD